MLEVWSSVPVEQDAWEIRAWEILVPEVTVPGSGSSTRPFLALPFCLRSVSKINDLLMPLLGCRSADIPSLASQLANTRTYIYHASPSTELHNEFHTCRYNATHTHTHIRTQNCVNAITGGKRGIEINVCSLYALYVPIILLSSSATFSTLYCKRHYSFMYGVSIKYICKSLRPLLIIHLP